MKQLLFRYKWLIAVVAVILVLVIISRVRSSTPEVTVAEARRGDLSLRIAASGLIEADATDLSFKGSGKLISLYVSEGEHVSRSQLLARTEPVPSFGQNTAGADVIKAPYDGAVVEAYVKPGTVLQPGQPVLRVVKSGGTWVTGFFDTEDAAYVRPGQLYKCRAGGYLSQPWEITVRTVGSQAVPRTDLPGSSRQVRIGFDFSDRPCQLPPGTEVDIDGHAPISADALLIPTAAVIRYGERDYVWLEAGGAVHRRDVKLGPNNFDLIQITDGLAEGDRVVVHGKSDLTEADRVRTKLMEPMTEPVTGGD